MGIRMHNRKLKPKCAKSVKRRARLKQAWDEGFRYGFNCYKPALFYKNSKLNDEFTKGFYEGMSRQ